MWLKTKSNEDPTPTLLQYMSSQLQRKLIRVGARDILQCDPLKVNFQEKCGCK
jgi:hypothetical protein